MRLAQKARRLFRNLFRRERVEEALDAELRGYVEELTERNLARGLSGDEARRAAMVEAGGVEQIKESVRETWLGWGIETVFQDIRYGTRSLLRSPGFMAVVIVTLALGIGANLTMFGLMRAVLWRPLPYPEPDRIVEIQVDARNRTSTGATAAELLGLQERSRSFEQVSTIQASDANLEYAGETEHLEAASVSDGFFRLLGIRPVLGRLLDAQVDVGKQQALAILISGELWRRRFDANPGIIGRAVRINGVDVQIAGVLPPGFRLYLPPSVCGLEQVEVWLPERLDRTVPYRGNPIVARLRAGVTRDRGNAELKMLAAQFERENPDYYSGAKGWQASPSDRGPGATVRFTARPLQESMTREVRPALLLLAGAVGFVLLIACVNVANLMLARGAARQQEFQIRRALGAGTVRIVRQLVAESLVLALAAGAAGLVCAHFSLAAIRRVGASHIPLQSRIEMDMTGALLALALSAGTTFLIGLVPAWRLAANRSGHSLRASRTGTVGAGARKLQRTLVVAEVALSIAPLAGAGLMLRSFLNLMHSPLGFNPANVVTARIPFDLKRYPHWEQRWALLRDAAGRVGALPGVQSVSAADTLPLADQETRRVGRPDQPDTPPILATQQFALPGYLGVMGTPLLEGRDFTDDDIAQRRMVTIVDEGLARRLWPEGAIGRILSIYRTGWRNDLEVIGVTAAVRVTRVKDGSVPHFMMPYGSYPNGASLVVKTRRPAEIMAPQIRSAVGAAQGGQSTYDIRPMSEYVADSVGDTRFVLFVLAAFAVASAALAAVGLYGTLAYLTAQRMREFGIRLALGSSVKALVLIVVREGILLAAAGTAAGLVGVLALTRAIQGLLFEVRPLDGVTLAGVVALVALIALGAAGVPAWRAARIDPQTSLRSE